MTKQSARRVYHSVGDYGRPSDCFCSDSLEREKAGWNFQHAGHVFDYIRQAVLEKLQRDGYTVAEGFDKTTGKELTQV